MGRNSTDHHVRILHQGVKEVGGLDQGQAPVPQGDDTGVQADTCSQTYQALYQEEHSTALNTHSTRLNNKSQDCHRMRRSGPFTINTTSCMIGKLDKSITFVTSTTLMLHFMEQELLRS